VQAEDVHTAGADLIRKRQRLGDLVSDLVSDRVTGTCEPNAAAAGRSIGSASGGRRLQETAAASFSMQEDDMSHRMSVVVALSLWTLTGCQASADPRPATPAGRLEILVDGAPRPAHGARGTWYIEALKGRPYAIRVTNPYPVRVAVALAVDGLNTIDARHTASAAARKWVIEPFGSVTISGWQTSLADARRFEFTTEARSYGASLGRTEDLGIVSAVFYRERVRQFAQTTARDERGRAGNASSAGVPKSAPAAAESPEYAATGMGRRIDHAVTAVEIELEEAPALSVALRYEYRPELVRLGVLRPEPPADSAMERRERASGFSPGFCPESKRRD
jgi:hypothetical protein